MSDKDIDFDELDRNVKGFTNSVEKSNDDVSANLIHSTSAPISEPPTLKPKVGRFMDVMHPSADMRLSPSVVAQERSKNPHRKKHKHNKYSKPEVEQSNLSKSLSPEEVPLPSVAGPALTPFLPDANEKVEKRPLGGAVQSFSSPDDKATESNKKELVEINTDNPIQSVPQPEISEKPVDESFVNEKFDEPENEQQRQAQLPANADSTQNEQSAEAKRLQEIESQEVYESGEALEHDLNPGQPTTQTEADVENDGPDKVSLDNDQQHSNIYDVKEYHQPIQYKAKKKTGWLKVLMIIGIIILFGGLAAALYYLLFVGA